MEKRKILFFCVHNACRSQIAEGWAKLMHSDWLDIYSAGITPTRVDPRVVEVMKEVGVDISSQYSKSIEDLSSIDFDYVIALCDTSKGACPVISAKVLYAHVPFDDPPLLSKDAKTEEEALKHYRRVRDEIKEFVAGLRKFLNVESASSVGNY